MSEYESRQPEVSCALLADLEVLKRTRLYKGVECASEQEGQWTSAADGSTENNEPGEVKHILADLGREFSVTNSVKLDCRGR